MRACVRGGCVVCQLSFGSWISLPTCQTTGAGAVWVEEVVQSGSRIQCCMVFVHGMWRYIQMRCDGQVPFSRAIACHFDANGEIHGNFRVIQTMYSIPKSFCLTTLHSMIIPPSALKESWRVELGSRETRWHSLQCTASNCSFLAESTIKLITLGNFSSAW